MNSITDKQIRMMVKAAHESAKAVRDLSAQVRELIAINQDLLAIMVERYEEDTAGDEPPAPDSMLLD